MRSIPRTAATAVVAMVAALTGSVGAAGGAHAATTAEVGGDVAATRCLAAYPQAPTGPDRLSPCQWDMGVIDAAGAWSKATGRGVRVGVIDGGVDFTHADLQGAIDVAAVSYTHLDVYKRQARRAAARRPRAAGAGHG